MVTEQPVAFPPTVVVTGPGQGTTQPVDEPTTEPAEAPAVLAVDPQLLDDIRRTLELLRQEIADARSDEQRNKVEAELRALEDLLAGIEGEQQAEPDADPDPAQEQQAEPDVLPANS